MVKTIDADHQAAAFDVTADDLIPRWTSPEERHPRPVLLVGLLLLVWMLVYVAGMFTPGLLDDADSVHAEAAREMVLRHDWVTLHIDGVRYLEKAPLMYWAIASSFKAFGVHDWSARLPVVLGVLALIACTCAFGRRFFGEEGGFYAALAIATSPGVYIFTRFLIPDALVALWLELGLLFFLVGYEQKKPARWACWGLAVSVALNVLTKGLIGIVFIGLVILIFLSILRDLAYLKKMRLASSALVFLLVAAPWHVLAAVRNPAEPVGPQKGFLWEYFVNEHFLRYLNQRIPHDYDKVPLVLFWVLVAVWLIPWASFLLPAFKQMHLRTPDLKDPINARGRANLLLMISAAIILLFFSLSSRQEYYTLPALPALALLVGGWLADESSARDRSQARRAGRRISAALFIAGFAGFVVAEALYFLTKPAAPGTQISDLLIDRPGTYTLSLGHLRDLTLQSLGIFGTPLWQIGIALLSGTGLAWWFRRRGSTYKSNLALGAMMVGVLFCVHQGYVIFSPELSSKPLALAIRQQYAPGDIIVLNGPYAWGSTLNFYTGAPVHLLSANRNDLWFGSLFSDAPKVFEDAGSFAQMWNGQSRVFLFTKEFNKQDALSRIDPASVYLLARQGNKMVFTNQPFTTASR
jgi:4-amino-4-deoxy-L-arabinose transferase-like glycosyltransferase